MTIYIVSVLTGQLWMMAFDVNDPTSAMDHTSYLLSSSSGGAAWGTCGCCTAMGIAQPPKRFLLFLTAIILVLLQWSQPYTSCYWGAIGASFFGWALYASLQGCFCPNQRRGPSHNRSIRYHPHQHQHQQQPHQSVWMTVVSTLVLLSIWTVPMVVLFWSRRNAQQQ